MVRRTTTLGSPSHPPLVFLHGFLGRGRDWLPVAETFKDRFYCILPDLPGHGENTDFPFETQLDYDFFVDDLIATLGEFRKINLIGYSMGGRTALYFALKYPERVQTLVLESTSPGIEPEHARLERCTLDDRWAEKIRANGMAAFVEEWYNIPLFRSLHGQPELLDRIKAARCENSSAWMAKVIAELSPGRVPYLGNQLSELKMPLLLLAGGLDEKYASGLEGFGAAIPSSVASVVPDAGHTVHAERPREFIRLLEKFPGLQSSI